MIHLSLENEQTLIQDRTSENKAKSKLFLKLLSRWIYRLNIVMCKSNACYGFIDKAKYRKMMYRNIVSHKRVHSFILSVAISAVFFCPPLIAQEAKGWQFGSLPANSSLSKTDDQQVYEVLLKMLDRWNAHDIEGYMEVYWKSPDLFVIVDSEQFNGWQQLHDSYVNGYPGATAMGFVEPSRIQVRLLKPDLALALTWWTINFPSSHQKVVGNTTMNLQKFDDGWKIVASHSSTNAT